MPTRRMCSVRPSIPHSNRATGLAQALAQQLAQMFGQRAPVGVRAAFG